MKKLVVHKFELFFNQEKINWIKLNRILVVQSQQWEHQNNVWSLFNVNNKYTRITFWCLYCQWRHSGFSIVNFKQILQNCFDFSFLAFEQVNVGLIGLNHIKAVKVISLLPLVKSNQK